MVKIWEVDFTSFSGTYPVDNIDNIPAVDVLGTVQSVTTLPDFSYRPGISLNANTTRDGYVFDRESEYVGCKGNYSGSYTTRSFICWFNLYDNAGTTGNNGVTGLYCENGGVSGANTGLFLYKTSFDNHRIRFYVNNTMVIEVPTGNIDLDTWHCAVLTVNKGTPIAKLYLDGVYINQTSTVPDNAYSGGTDLETLLGLPVSFYEPPVKMGYIATYSEELSPTSISGIYDTFLVDSLAGDDPAFVISGTVYDTRDLPASGTSVYLINTSDNELADIQVTSSGGDYTTYIPFSGDYILVSANNTPSVGARALSLTASGVAGSGTITFYDGS